MTKRMLVDATHPEETRVAIVESYRDNNRLEDFDFSLASKPILRGNIYLAKVMRIEPSLQAAFVEYGGNRHGFLPFNEIHYDYYRIPVADRPQDEDEDGDEEMYDIGELPEGYEDSLELDAEQPAAPQAEAMASDVISAPAPVEEPVEATAAPAQDQPQAEILASEQPHPLLGMGEQPHEDENGVGLIMDFGNAAIGDSHMTEVATPQTPPESVGGEVTERVVRHHRPRYKIQEVLKRGQIMLIQVVKEERGNKGAALTTYLSLAGRYCVLMPNTDHGGGVSRKITNHQDRRRMKEILDQLEIPEGMAVILRTAGMEMAPPDIQRDLDYLIRLWENIREETLQSTAPALIYEEANLIKRSVRDLYTHDIAEILIAGREGYDKLRDFMRAIMPDEVEKIKYYEDAIPLFIRYQVENQIDTLNNPVAQLRSGGYLVINPTEALVSIDVNSGRATRERHIEETALKTNLEAADEIARQLRLRDLAGLVVIDFIDMEDGRNNAAVERRVKEAMKNDRARLQIGRISPFGLLELSRQRLRPSLAELNFEKCPICSGTGIVRSPDSASLSALRAIEEECIRQRSSEITMTVPGNVAVYILNHKRDAISELEGKYGIHIVIMHDDHLPPPGYKLERAKGRPVGGRAVIGPAVNTEQVLAEVERDMPVHEFAVDEIDRAPVEDQADEEQQDEGRSGRRNGRGRRRFRDRDRRPARGGDRGDRAEQTQPQQVAAEGSAEPSERSGEQAEGEANGNAADERDNGEGFNKNRRRRGRRGGRRRGPHGNDRAESGEPHAQTASAQDTAQPHVAHAQAPVAAPVAKPQNAPKPYIPTSIHDLDTTPRPMGEEPPRDRSYEVVNPPTDSPKAGWWRRLTGQ